MESKPVSSDLNIKKENQRINALNRYDILDTANDTSFDRLTRFAVKLFNIPIAVISFVDTDRIWYKSKQGIEITETPREPGLCATAILKNGTYVVENAPVDKNACNNSLVAGPEKIRFYAAAQLKTRDGYNIGTFGVMDTKPGKFTELQKQMLQDLSEIIMDEMDLRLTSRKREEAVELAKDRLSLHLKSTAQKLQSIPVSVTEINEALNETNQAITQVASL